jgi:hypothetical protein
MTTGGGQWETLLRRFLMTESRTKPKLSYIQQSSLAYNIYILHTVLIMADSLDD